MSYSTSNPPALIAQRVGADGGALWVYRDADPLSTVAAINYVSNASKIGLKAGDSVIHIDTTLKTTTNMVANAHRTSGTAAGASCSAVEPVAETSIALASAGTGTFLVDDIIYFDNDPDQNEYRVTTGDTDVSDGGTLVITPGLVVATAVGTGIKIKSNVINLAQSKEGQLLIEDSPATRTLLADESGAVLTFDRAAGQVLTLPPAVPGLEFEFIVTVSLTSNAYSVLCDTGDFLVGGILGAIEGAATDEYHFANGTTHLGLSMNKTTTGGLIGTHIKVKAISSTLWIVEGVASCTTAPATPFTT